MSYTKNSWKSGDVVTSVKLNNIEDGLYNVTGHVEMYADPRGGAVGQVLTRCQDDTYSNVYSEWRSLPNTKKILEISSEEATQIYMLVEQLKTAADSAPTKMAAMGVPFDGTFFLTNLVYLMFPEEAVPEIKIVSSDPTKNKYLLINDVTTDYASFGYTETSAATLYEVRFFVNTTSIIVRVTSCPFSIVKA